MQLIYRGYTYIVDTPVILPVKQPSALNWRYRIASNIQELAEYKAPIAIKPRALNWRYQTTAMA